MYYFIEENKEQVVETYPTVNVMTNYDNQRVFYSSEEFSIKVKVFGYPLIVSSYYANETEAEELKFYNNQCN